MKNPLIIQTPAGPMRAPAGKAARLAQMNDEELFASVHQNPFVDPFALGEIQRRNKLAAYYRWQQEAPSRKTP